MKYKLDTLTQKSQGIILGLFSGILWAINLTLINHSITLPNTLYLLTFISILIFFLTELYSLIILLLIYRKRVLSQIYKERKLIFSQGYFFFICPIGMLCYVTALISIGADNVAIISSIYPIIAILLSRFILKYKLNLIQYISILSTVIGIIILSGKFQKELLGILGFLLALSSAICWGIEAILCDYYSNNKHNINLLYSEVLLTIRYSCSVILGGSSLVLFLYFFQQDLNLSEIKFTTLYLKLFPISIMGLFSYLCYYQAINKIGAVFAINLNISYMLWVIIFSLFYQPINSITLIGAGFILFSILTISFKGKI